MTLHFVYINDTDNIGDNVCSPYMYFDFPEFQVHNLDDVLDVDLKGTVVYGGGAIMGRAKRSAAVQSGKTVLWGVGNTRRYQTGHEPANTYEFTLAGVRDFHKHTKNARYLPCVSCMDSSFLEFHTEYFNQKYDVFVYGHKQVKPIDDLVTNISSDYNVEYAHNEMAYSLREIVKKMVSARCIVTSSYHGAYWAMLLNKPVIVIPFGSKFFHYKNAPYYLNNSRDLNNAIEKQLRLGRSGPEYYLNECIELNRRFYNEFIKLL